VESSVLDIAAALEGQVDGSFVPEHAPERLGEVRHIYLDTTRARAELEWQAQVTLSEGMQRTLDSLR
jgi:UDP-glucose 4-epimerase